MSAIELMSNGGFECGWTDLLPVGGLTNQQPLGFSLAIRGRGEPLMSAGFRPDESPIFEIVEIVPECVHKLRSQLPAHETQPGGLIRDGDTTFKIFAASRPFSVRLIWVGIAPADGTIQVRVPVQVHSHGDGSPGAAVWRVNVGPIGYRGKWRTFGDGFVDREWEVVELADDVLKGDRIYVDLCMESRALGGIDFFTDGWSVLFTPDETPEQPAPQPVDYVVVVNLVPQDVTEDEAAHVLRATHAQRESIVRSANDAARLVAPGQQGSYVRVWAPARWPDGDIVDWLRQRGVGMVEVSWFPGTPPPVTPVEPPEEPPVTPPTGHGFGNLPKALAAGLHYTAAAPACLERYIVEGKPSLVKAFSCGDAYRAGRIALAAGTGTRVVWRRHVSDGEFITGNLHSQAERFLDLYLREVDATAAAARQRGETLTADEIWHSIDYLGGLNELISNWSPLTETQVAFEVEFARLIDEQVGHGVKATMLAVPVGNPNHDPVDVERLLPAAEMSAEHGHVLDYHAYWTSGREAGRSYLDQEWRWLAGRWTEWDEVFARFGVAPLYMFGESGIVYDPTGGSWVGSGLAWKAAGSVLYYIEQIARMNERIQEWNQTHGNRCLGGVLFTCEKTYGWEQFLLGNGDLLEILKWMVTL